MMRTPLSVTHAVLSLDCGGLERIVVDLVREGQQRGQRVSVLCLEQPGTLAPQIADLGARVVSLNKAPGLRWETINRAAAVLRELQPDVLHTHQIGVLLYTGPAAQKAHVPTVVHTEHINQIVKARSWSRRLRTRLQWGWAARHAARFFCVAADIAREVARFGVVPARKIQVLLNGIDVPAFAQRTDNNSIRATLGIPQTAPVVGTVGRLNEVKRQDFLIRAFSQMRERFPEAHLILVGDGPARDDLEALVRSLGLTSVTHFAGYQAHPERFLQIMDVFALTSRIEGMPLAILEAWAAGVPVVASAVGGVPDMITHGENGLLFPCDDQPALIAAMEGLLTDRRRACDLGQAGQDYVTERFSLARMAAEYERHYRELLTHLRRSPACAS